MSTVHVVGLRSFPLALGIAVAAGAALAPTPASACGRAIELETRPVAQLLAEADRALESGEYMEAARLADETEHAYLFTYRQEWWRSRILVQAAIRTGGAIAPSARYGRTLAKAERTRQRNLRRAVATLERMMKAPALKDDPVLLSAYGEGLAQVPGRQAEALKVLTRLADDDLITSPRTWGALAELRAAEGQDGAAALARESCQAMASDDETCQFRIAQGVM